MDRAFDEVQRGVDAALRDFGKAMNGSMTSETTSLGKLANAADADVAGRVDKIGKVSALAIVQASQATAKDIKAAAQTAVDLAATIMREADQLAADLHGRAEKISEYLREFGSLAQKVSTTMRETRAEVLSLHDLPMPRAGLLPQETAPPVANIAGND